MKTYNIADLIPIEDSANLQSLRFLTQLWRNHHGFDGLPVPPYVAEIDSKLYLTGGNQRAIWSLLNKMTTIEAEEESEEEILSMKIIYLIIEKENAEKGIHSLVDFAKGIQHPEQYSAEGPMTHSISIEDLQNPRYFLGI